MGDATLCSILEAAAGSRRGLGFVDRHEQETRLEYGELHRRALAAAGAFQEEGVRPGDRLAIVLPTCPEFVCAFWGALLAGAIPVPLYPPVRLGRMEEYHQRTARMLSISGATLVCTSDRVKRVLGQAVAGAVPALGMLSMDRIDGAACEPVGVRADDPALIQFSSGSTVDPKPVLLTHRQILANVDAIRNAILDAYPEIGDYVHSGVSWLPLYHDMGLIGCLLLAVSRPADLTLIPPELFVARPAVWLRAISRRRATLSMGPNFAFSLCAQRVEDRELEGVDLSSWVVAGNGAEPVIPSALERFIERFRPYGFKEQALTPVYGLSEAALAVTLSDFPARYRIGRFRARDLLDGVATPDPEGRPLVSVGRPLPGYQLLIADERDAACPEGRVGRVLVKGPSVMKGYYGQEAATRAAFVDGWLDTGDLGFLHQGELYLDGRLKDLVIVRGKNYSPQAIEMALNGLPGMRTGCAAAVGHVPEGGGGEGLLVFLERDRKADASGDRDLEARASRRITEATDLVPDRVMVLEPGTLPRTSSGKLRRRDTLRQYLSGTLAPPEPVTFFRMAAEVVRSSAALRGLERKQDS